jgi:Asp-tRNA(Asn)/Glu-tRNA(Gln) amidotransferase A subunit family amidase
MPRRSTPCTAPVGLLSVFFTRYDILLTPTMCTPPQRLGEVSMMKTDIEAFNFIESGDVAFTQLFNASGNPAMSVPLHWSTEGLPMGVQFVARLGMGQLFFG